MQVEKESNIKIIKGSMLAYISLAVNILAGIIYTPWMVTQIGQSNYGLYTLAISLSSVLMFDFGIGQAVTRFVAKYRSAGKINDIQNLMGILYKIYFSIDLLILAVSIVIFVNLDAIYTNVSEDEMAALKVIFVIVMSYNMFAFPFTQLNGIMEAYEAFAQLKMCELLGRIMTIILVVVSLLRGYGLYALVLANIFSGISMIVFKWIYVHFKIKMKANIKAFDSALFKNLLNFSIWTAVGGLATTIGTNLMPSIVAAAKGAIETALFGAANTLNGYAYLLTNALGGMFLPKVTRVMADKGAAEQLDTLSIRVGRILMVISATIIIGYWCIGEDFFATWMGPEYRNAYYCALGLLIGELLFNPFQIYNTAMIAEGHVKVIAIVKMVTALLSLVLGYVLASFIGATGAGIAVGVCYTIRGACNLVLFRKYLGSDIKQFLAQVYRPFSIMLWEGIMLKVITKLINLYGWLGIGAKSLLIVLVLLVTVWFYILKEEERIKITNCIRRK